MHNYNLSYMHWFCLFAPIWISYWGAWATYSHMVVDTLWILITYGGITLYHMGGGWGPYAYGKPESLMENHYPLYRCLIMGVGGRPYAGDLPHERDNQIPYVYGELSLRFPLSRMQMICSYLPIRAGSTRIPYELQRPLITNQDPL
jgi:hypothetical protein